MLKRAINENRATIITQRVYEWIQEVDYYLTARYEDKTYSKKTIQQKREQLREISSLDEEFENMMRGVAI